MWPDPGTGSPYMFAVPLPSDGGGRAVCRAVAVAATARGGPTARALASACGTAAALDIVGAADDGEGGGPRAPATGAELSLAVAVGAALAAAALRAAAGRRRVSKAQGRGWARAGDGRLEKR